MTLPLTLMAVHAHPDDESSSTGGVLARYSAEGVRTVVVTCTNGEYGDAPGEIKPGQPGHDPQLVAKIRKAELETACEILGVTHLEMLGYHDSGMSDWTYQQDDLAFCNVELEVAAARVAALIEQYQPQVVVTYDDNGGYGHPDHIQAHRVTMAALGLSPSPAKVYLTARRRADWQRLRQLLEEQGVELPAPPPPDPQREEEQARREARISTAVDLGAYAERKRAALTAHASQLHNIRWLRLAPPAMDGLFSRETFIRHHDTTGAPTPEDDLFAGLR
ncbi:MAG TPA: PIG-L family deacetylase [Mycobacteriales bacterium]|nr:PIG-L family deacetylase [Mycobacteriales bacterium]